MVTYLSAVLYFVRIADLTDLIADGIEDHRGMVVGQIHHGCGIFLPVRKEVGGIIKVHLRHRPGVAKLQHNEHPQLVTGLQHRPAGWKMRAAYCVIARFLELSDAPESQSPVFHHSDHAVILVDAAAPELDGLAVNAKSAHSVEGKRANAEARVLRVQSLQFCHAVVQVRAVNAPELRVLQRKAQRYCPGLARQERHRSAELRIADPMAQTKRLLLRLPVDQGGLDQKRRRFLIRFRHRDLHAARRDMNAACPQQPHVPVDAGARIPAAGRNAVSHQHLDSILSRL